MIVSASSGICHGRQLIAVSIEPLLTGVLGAHVVPLAIGLGSQIMEMAEVTGLFVGKFREIRQKVFCKFCGEVVSFDVDIFISNHVEHLLGSSHSSHGL